MRVSGGGSPWRQPEGDVRHSPYPEAFVKPILVAVLGLLGLGALFVLGTSSSAQESAARDWWR